MSKTPMKLDEFSEMMKFQKDLQDGQRLEWFLGEHFKRLNWVVSYPQDGKFKPYDLTATINGKTVKLECKYDLMMSRTGNHAIEFECNGQPSGIASTEADYWCVSHTDNDDCFMFNVKKLKNYCQDATGLRVVSGGDGGRAKMFLVNFGLLRTDLAPTRIELHGLNIPF